MAKQFNFYIGRKNRYLALPLVTLLLNRNDEKWPDTSSNTGTDRPGFLGGRKGAASLYMQVITQPRTQDLSLGKTLAAAGHVPHQKFSARGGVGKVSNYINMLPV